MVDGLFFCTTLTGRRGGHTPFVQVRAKAFDTGAEAAKPAPRCSWQVHSRRMGAYVGDVSTESRSVFQPNCLPSVIRPERRTSVVILSLLSKHLFPLS